MDEFSEKEPLEVVTGLVRARELVREWVNHEAGRTVLFSADVFVVWFSKTLHHWKALVSTTLKDNRYYEITYDGVKGQTYIDVYEKIENLLVSDDDPGNFKPGGVIYSKGPRHEKKYADLGELMKPGPIRVNENELPRYYVPPAEKTF